MTEIHDNLLISSYLRDRGYEDIDQWMAENGYKRDHGGNWRSHGEHTTPEEEILALADNPEDRLSALSEAAQRLVGSIDGNYLKTWPEVLTDVQEGERSVPIYVPRQDFAYLLKMLLDLGILS